MFLLKVLFLLLSNHIAITEVCRQTESLYEENDAMQRLQVGMYVSWNITHIFVPVRQAGSDSSFTFLLTHIGF